MGLFYKVQAKELFEIRNEIFINKGFTALKKNGFEVSPFSGTRFGKYDASLYAYDLCRLNAHGHLETIATYISKKDRWIKIHLNIFKPLPDLTSLDQLEGLDGMQFHIPPNSISKMRLRSSDIKGMSLFNTTHHKIKSFYTKWGFQRRVDKLSRLIESDMENIDNSVRRWHELHIMMETDWNGVKIS